MKNKSIKEIIIVVMIIVISIAGIDKLNETINYQIKVTTIDKIIVAEKYDEAEKSIKNSSLKVKDIDMLHEKIRKGKETENVE